MQAGTVTFDEEQHKYFVDGVPMESSVTQLVGTYFSEFDSEAVATNMLTKSSFLTESRYEQYRAILRDTDRFSIEARDMIVAHWKTITDEAAALGTKMHKSIEAFYNHGTMPEPMTKEFSMFLNFDSLTDELGFVPFRTEQVVFDRELSLAGSVDMLYVRADNIASKPTKIWLVDWKRSKEIKMNAFGNARGHAPFQALPDCNYQHYSIQLNLYKYLLEKNYDMSIERMTLVILHPNQDSYIMLDVNDIQPLIVQALEVRLQERRKQT